MTEQMGIINWPYRVDTVDVW